MTTTFSTHSMINTYRAARELPETTPRQREALDAMIEKEERREAEAEAARRSPKVGGR